MAKEFEDGQALDDTDTKLSIVMPVEASDALSLRQSPLAIFNSTNSNSSLPIDRVRKAAWGRTGRQSWPGDHGPKISFWWINHVRKMISFNKFQVAFGSVSIFERLNVRVESFENFKLNSTSIMTKILSVESLQKLL